MKERNETIEEAYVSFYDLFYKVAYGRLKVNEDAEDAVQQTFMLGLRYFHTFDPDRNGVGAWLRKILDNVCNAQQQDMRNKGVSMEFNEELHHEGVEMTHLGDQLKERIRGHITEYDNADTRSALTMYFVNGAKPTEISHVVGLKISAIEWLTRKFSTKMKEMYA